LSRNRRDGLEEGPVLVVKLKNMWSIRGRSIFWSALICEGSQKTHFKPHVLASSAQLLNYCDDIKLNT